MKHSIIPPRFAALAVLLTLAPFALIGAEKYRGPVPEVADVPHLMHADNLIPLETANASEKTNKDRITYTLEGAASTVRTPMSEPIFIIKTNSDPQKLTLYPFEIEKGSRSITFNSRKPKDNPSSIRFTIEKLDEGLYKLEVQQYMQNGEYALSPDGSNVVFAFQVY